jgi:hypothetical protein
MPVDTLYIQSINTGDDTMKHTQQIAQRQINAFNHLVESLETLGEIDYSQAVSIAYLYLDNKLAKLDAVHGRSHVKHGAFLERDVIRRACREI